MVRLDEIKTHRDGTSQVLGRIVGAQHVYKCRKTQRFCLRQEFRSPVLKATAQ